MIFKEAECIIVRMHSDGKDLQIFARGIRVAKYADGSLLVSDDFAGKVYRISYLQPQTIH